MSREEGKMTNEEFNRLASGDFRTGDYVRDRTTPWVWGKIIGRGALGHVRGLFWRVETPLGDMFILVENAIAQGVT